MGKLLVGFSFLWSLFSFTSAHMGSLSGHRDYFPIKSKIFLFSSVLFASIVRVMSMVLYFAPSLGLFNLLRHYQAEMLGYEMLNPADKYGNNKTVIFPSDTIINETLSQIQRGNYIPLTANSTYLYEPPKIEMYTQISL